MLLRYHVSYRNEEWKPGCDEQAILDEMGIIACNDYNDAVTKLEQYYGEGDICKFEFMPLEDILTKDDFSSSYLGDIWD